MHKQSAPSGSETMIFAERTSSLQENSNTIYLKTDIYMLVLIPTKSHLGAQLLQFQKSFHFTEDGSCWGIDFKTLPLDSSLAKIIAFL